MGGMKPWQFDLRTAFYATFALCIAAALLRGACYSPPPYCDICWLSLGGMVVVLFYVGREVYAAGHPGLIRTRIDWAKELADARWLAAITGTLLLIAFPLLLRGRIGFAVFFLALCAGAIWWGYRNRLPNS